MCGLVFARFDQDERTGRQGAFQMAEMHSPVVADTLVRASQILGDPKKGIPPIIPISRSGLYKLIQNGQFPKPDVVFNARVVCWRLSTIAKHIEKFSTAEGGSQ
jgi:hypothetical protein